MSDKAECPGCGSYTSGVLQADIDGQPCPYCGLSHAARAEIRAVRRRRADQALKDQAERLIKELAKANAELAALRRFRASVENALKNTDGT